MNTQDLESKLKVLRKRWVEEPHNRKTIEYQAKLLRMAIEKRDKVSSFEKDIKATLF